MTNDDHALLPPGYRTRRAGWLAGTIRLSAAAATYDPRAADAARERARAERVADAEHDGQVAALVRRLRAERPTARGVTRRHHHPQTWPDLPATDGRTTP